MTIAHPLPWLKTLIKLANELQEIPLWGSAPPFGWEVCADCLRSLLAAETVQISSGPSQWRTERTVFEGLGDAPLHIALTTSLFEGAAHWLMPQDSGAVLLSKTPGTIDADYAEGFYRYLCLEVLTSFSYSNTWGDLRFQMQSDPLPIDEGLSLDVHIEIDGRSLWGRLHCSSSFLSGFKAHFGRKPPSIKGLEMAKNLPISLPVEVGNATLSLEEWRQVKVGDFIVLDRCTFDPDSLKGSASLLLQQVPLFRIRLKPNSLKILDYAFYAEEPMENIESNQGKGEGDEGEVPSLPEEEGEGEGGELLAEEPASEEHLWSPPPKGLDGAEKVIHTHQLPISLSVEVGRVSMNMEKLLELQIGNVLELPVRPEQGVSLTVGGRTVARGELMKVGEVLGVRILDIHNG